MYYRIPGRRTRGSVCTTYRSPVRVVTHRTLSYQPHHQPQHDRHDPRLRMHHEVQIQLTQNLQLYRLLDFMVLRLSLAKRQRTYSIATLQLLCSQNFLGRQQSRIGCSRQRVILYHLTLLPSISKSDTTN